MTPLRWKPNVTVAAVIEDAGRFLLVEEETREGLRLNNPAGHLDPGESPEQAVVREVREETARVFTPTQITGLYLARFQRPAAETPSGQQEAEDITYLRITYAGTVGERLKGLVLDDPIVRTVWLSADDLRASAHQLRSPLVLRCIEDHLAGRRYPLDLIWTHGSIWQPADILSFTQPPAGPRGR